MKDLNDAEQVAMNAHLAGISALLGTAAIITLIHAPTEGEHRDELARILWERHGQDVYDPKMFAVSRKPNAAVAIDGSMDFHLVPRDTMAHLNVAGLAHALRLWREETARKGWPDTDSPDHEQDARYLLAIALSGHCDRFYKVTGYGRDRTVSKEAQAISLAISDAIEDGAVGGCAENVAGILQPMQSDFVAIVEKILAHGHTLNISVYPPDVTITTKDEVDEDPTRV